MLSLLLASLHHLTLLGLIVMVSRQGFLLQQSPLPLAALGKLDKGVGMGSGFMLVIGICRVLWGEKGWAFYQGNPFFWAKMATFVLIGLLSIRPTLLFIRWERAHARDRSYTPPDKELAVSRQFIVIELALVCLLFIFAAAMARWPF
ncbi:DUF2214 family protein [uncultured Brevundimonas sp.]|uniref:DUF2214 family protein n=1 Tax=uncultured Brevundimonas sp. TaxID=213418 RepID=UPI0026173E3C|nr:DUF2214 family protein [uncultured Brevundimonas sp.]